jgi:hypothetical protein
VAGFQQSAREHPPQLAEADHHRDFFHDFLLIEESYPMQPPKIASFQPPRRTLMGPGPSDVPQRILDAMARPTIGHLDPAFTDMMEQTKTLLRYAFQTGNKLTFPVSGPGSVGMETCFVNLVEPGDKVIVCVNGVFGGRMLENVKRCGGVPVVVEDAWGRAVDPAKVEAAFASNPDAKMLAFVHAETSTGAQSDGAALAAIARKHGALTIMDCVTSLGGTPVLIDAWGIDAAYSGSQKCLSCTPGLSPVTFSRARHREGEGAQDAGAKLVHGPEPGAGLLERRGQAHLPPHRADQSALRPARGPGDAGRGGHRERLGAAPRQARGAQGRPGGWAWNSSCRRRSGCRN